MENENKKVTLMGSRVKELMKLLSGENGKFKNTDLAQLWHYENQKSVSQFLNGVPIDIDRVNALQNEIEKQTGLRIRLEYLAGVDYWKTDEEMMRYAHIEDIENFTICRKYLETLGFTIKPFLQLRMSITSIYKKWDILKDYLTDNSVKEITDNYDMSLNPLDFQKKYFKEFNTNKLFNLRKPIDNPDFSFDNIGKENIENFGLINSVKCSDDNNPIKINCDYIIGFSIKYQDNDTKIISISALQDFMRKIDLQCKFTIETFLLNHYTSIKPI